MEAREEALKKHNQSKTSDKDEEIMHELEFLEFRKGEIEQTKITKKVVMR